MVERIKRTRPIKTGYVYVERTPEQMLKRIGHQFARPYLTSHVRRRAGRFTNKMKDALGVDNLTKFMDLKPQSTLSENYAEIKRCGPQFTIGVFQDIDDTDRFEQHIAVNGVIQLVKLRKLLDYVITWELTDLEKRIVSEWADLYETRIFGTDKCNRFFTRAQLRGKAPEEFEVEV